MNNNNLLIDGIKEAIAFEKDTLKRLTAERDEILPVLTRAHFIDASDLHRIEGKYATKIENTAYDIQMMEKHLRELTRDV
jgi:hypothetical protein